MLTFKVIEATGKMFTKIRSIKIIRIYRIMFPQFVVHNYLISISVVSIEC